MTTFVKPYNKWSNDRWMNLRTNDRWRQHTWAYLRYTHDGDNGWKRYYK